MSTRESNTAASAAKHFVRTRGHRTTRVVRKFRRERLIGRYLANPAIGLLSRLGIRTTYATELQTVGAKTGLRRSVPVSAAFDDRGAWVISQHGRRSGWARNVAANPQVRIRQGRQWRTGTAAFMPDDDVVARGRTFAPNRILAPLVSVTFRALASDPISVRILFSDDVPNGGPS
ncbi:MAG: nitroreductase family deazaflavin-dependent oxidoreductase [Mycolicibacterium sp.]|uniref:nitroreductase family deazaflavin-dependent oxidoreductase n=1 Tax=Mycolicibacterium sp. TaxID=2320850 RepID=UPI003D0B67AC